MGVPAADDPVPFHHIDTVFNASPANVFAANEKVGILETGGQCRLYEEHEAFAALAPQGGVNTHTSSGGRIHYQLPPVPCSTASDCNVACGNPSTPPACISGECVVFHGSAVASVVSASAGSSIPRGAGQATLYFPNSAGPSDVEANPTVGCSPQATEAAYDWLAYNGVRTVNESFTCRTSASSKPPCDSPESYELPRDNEGITQDWYARHGDILIVRAAGNKHCGDADEACPYSLNSLCVGGNRFASPAESAVMSCFSTWRNPGTEWAPAGLVPELHADREEPDLTALAGSWSDSVGACQGQPNEGVRTLTLGGPGLWGGAAGTSFAAPAVTSMAALAREACRQRWGELDARFLRSMLRTAAWGGNPDGIWRYSTPLDPQDPSITDPLDRLDGAGLLLAEGVMEFCSPGGEGTVGGWEGVDLSGDEGPFPGDHGDYWGNGWTPPGETPQSKVMEYGTAPSQVGDLHNKKLWRSERQLSGGARIRATLSWDSCPLDVTGAAPANRGVDFDLFIVNADTGWIAYASQSVDDVNEGFDVIIPSEQEPGNYELWIAWPDGSPLCPGFSVEPIGWTLRFWP